MSTTTKKYLIITFLVVVTIAPGIGLSWYLKTPGMLFPTIATIASGVGLLVVVPYMAVTRMRRTKGDLRLVADYKPPEGLTPEEQRRSIARQTVQGVITVALLLALLLVVAWRTLQSRH